MGIEIYSKDIGEKWETFIYLCNTSDTALPNMFFGTVEDAEDFMKWCKLDVREYTRDELDQRFYEWKKEQEDEENIK